MRSTVPHCASSDSHDTARSLKSNKQSIRIKLKPLGYACVLVLPMMPFLAYFMSNRFGGANFWAFAGIAIFYLVIPTLDFIIGKDSTNPIDGSRASKLASRYYGALTVAASALGVMSLLGGTWLFVSWEALSLVGKAGLVISFGTLHAGLMINTAHELIHRNNRFEQRLGGFLLCMVCYPGFKIEHIRGHHIHVATPLDNSTARLNQSLYDFVPRAIVKNIRTAWRLEQQRLQKRGGAAWSINNELLCWYAIVLFIAVGLTMSFGSLGLVFFIAQSVVAIVILECVNYVEHYGLRRRQKENGRYERTTIEHSWNSNYLLSNLLTFQLQRHADHHANPQRRYQKLRHFEQSPQLPAGYSAMIVLALFPALWKKVMNAKLADFRQATLSA